MESILLVHPSKVVRATLAHTLKPHFKILEAENGESAWQLLVLQQQIQAVICGLDVSLSGESLTTSSRISGIDPQLSGIDLLERLRNNSLARLKHIPFYLIGSETHIADISQEAAAHQVTGLLRIGMDAQEILDIFCVYSHVQKEENAPQITNLRSTGLLSAPLFLGGAERLFSLPSAKGAILVFGIKDYEPMTKKLGTQAVDGIVKRLAELMESRINQGDFVGYCSMPGCFAIATKISNPEQCQSFAEKIATKLASAKISIRGEALSIRIHFGVASLPSDGKLSGNALLNLALQRLKAR